MKLRDYQLDGVQKIRCAFRKHRMVLYQAPTGSGKTVLFCYIVKNASKKNKRVGILVHRQELIWQTHKKLLENGVGHGIVWGKYPAHYSQNVQICSVQSLVNRMDSMEPFDLLIIDEAHHATAGTYKRILEHYSDAKVLGVTATPERTDGYGLSNIGFETLILGPPVKHLISKGYLADYRLFIPDNELDLTGVRRTGGDWIKSQLGERLDKAKVTGNAIAHYQKHARGTKAIAFCVSLKHMSKVLEDCNKAGITAATIDGKMSDGLRTSTLKDFRNGRIQWLISCELINEGFDVPDAETAILLRPTVSTGLYLQQIGRILRPSGTKVATIFDHVANTAKHGPVDMERDWVIEGKRKNNSNNAPALKLCDECFRLLKPGNNVCPECGAIKKVNSRKLEEVEGELREADTATRAGLADKAKDRRERLLDKAREKGLKYPGLYASNVIRWEDQQHGTQV